jgi:hypothetical protein
MKRKKLLTTSLERRLNSYALAASAAGLGMVCLAPHAEAKIIYTKTFHVVDLKYGMYALDLNNDGWADFVIRVQSYQSCSSECPKKSLGIGGYSNAIAFRGRSMLGSFLADDLKGGSGISGKDYFYRWVLLAGSKFRHDYGGNWFNVKDRYLGLTFQINGKKHYGWARMNVRTHRRPFSVSGTLTGYAYETIPNKPIIAGKTHGPDVVTVQPASLGHLAHGAAAIPAWRRTSSPAGTR